MGRRSRAAIRQTSGLAGRDTTTGRPAPQQADAARTPGRSSEGLKSEGENEERKTRSKVPKCQRPRTKGARTSGAADYSVVVPAPELSSINVAVSEKISIAAAFRKGRPCRLVWNFADHRPPRGGRRGGRWRGLLRCGLRRLAELPDRPVGKGHHQHHRCDDSRQNTRDRLRIHGAAIPSPVNGVIPWKSGMRE